MGGTKKNHPFEKTGHPLDLQMSASAHLSAASQDLLNITTREIGLETPTILGPGVFPWVRRAPRRRCNGTHPPADRHCTTASTLHRSFKKDFGVAQTFGTRLNCHL